MSLEAILGSQVTGKAGSVPVSSFSGEGKVVGIYFSAHWCPPCRGFTPKLADWYKQMKAGADGARLEIVFVSSDRDEDSFNKYFEEQPWLAVPFNDRDLKGELCDNFDVAGIPMLVFVDGNGKLITKDGRSKVTAGASISEIK